MTTNVRLQKARLPERSISRIVSRATENGSCVVLTTIFPLGRLPLARRLVWSNDIGTAIDEVNDHIGALADTDVHMFITSDILTGSEGAVLTKYSKDFLHLNQNGYDALNAELDADRRNIHEERPTNGRCGFDTRTRGAVNPVHRRSLAVRLGVKGFDRSRRDITRSLHRLVRHGLRSHSDEAGRTSVGSNFVTNPSRSPLMGMLPNVTPHSFPSDIIFTVRPAYRHM